MKIIKTKTLLAKAIQKARAQNATIGFVPTMGALHPGHISLINAAKTDGHFVVASIFINPTQFNDISDFDKYPRVPERDLQLLYEANCDLVFMPTPDEMYSDNELVQKVDFGIITNSLEGAFRQRHFDGVVAIVKKLFEAANPDVAYFGLKDYQKCMVIKKMTAEYKLAVRLKFMPTIRESNGLAMSSRNSRLNKDQIKRAGRISELLNNISQYLTNQRFVDVNHVIAETTQKLNEELRVEYIAIRQAEDFDEVQSLTSGMRYVVLIAAWCDNVRLIDNVEFIRK